MRILVGLSNFQTTEQETEGGRRGERGKHNHSIVLFYTIILR